MSIFIRRSLEIEIYTIGYPIQGESIVFIILVDDRNIYSGVVDCYEESLNITMDLLKAKGIDKLDFICWTHTDEDHSAGLDQILDDYTSEITKVIIPEEIENIEYEYSERVRATLDKLKSNRGRHKTYKVQTISDNKKLQEIEFRNEIGESYLFNIWSVAPSSELVRDKKTNKTLKKNDYSIMLKIGLGELRFLLGGDVENTTFEKFEDWYLNEGSYDFIKTPHHTSKNANKLLSFLSPEIRSGIVCSTVFKKGRSNHPEENSIKQYRSYCNEFYCTNNLKGTNEASYGMVGVKYDVIHKSVKRIELKGNASIIYEKV